jgi:hydrophobic/amphiphilic exporter-1 (mainly G- bacteria), HAE1 family
VVRVNQRPVSIVEGLIEEGGTARATSDVRADDGGAAPPAGCVGHHRCRRGAARTTEQLGLVALLSVALVFLVLAGEFASFTIPLVVMITVPLAAAGGLCSSG